MGPQRPVKRVRSDEIFFDQNGEHTGSYLRLKLVSGKPVKAKGWPWVQVGVRGVIGDTERLEKASFLGDGSLLMKTKNKNQTEKFLKVQQFAGETCEVIRDQQLNTTKRTIHAYDLIDLTEDEIVRWLEEFGVVGARRFTTKKNGKVENTPTILLTFNKPTCPTKLQLDYVTYHVHQYIPNPLMCYQCGRFGHPEVRCQNAKTCLQCGKGTHDGECVRWCINCKKTGHSCLSRECEVWVKEKEICRIKTDQELSYFQARKQYETTHETPVLRAYAAVVRTPSAAPSAIPSTTNKHEEDLKEKVSKLEKKVGEMVSLLQQLLNKQNIHDVLRTEGEGDTDKGDTGLDMDTEKGQNKPKEGGNEHDGAMEEMTQETSEGQAVEWKTVGRGKQQQTDKRKGQSLVNDHDEITPSPAIMRPSRSLERGGSRQHVRKKSWREEPKM